ncbi:hypothetical protein FOZ60_001786, partial [Perkinsus olseni]
PIGEYSINAYCLLLLMMLSHHRGLASSQHSLSAWPLPLVMCLVRIYRDEHCFEKTGTLLLEAAGGLLHANTFDPDQSSAFNVKTVDFTPNNGQPLRHLGLRTASENASQFTLAPASEPVTGTTYGIYTVRYRNEEVRVVTVDDSEIISRDLAMLPMPPPRVVAASCALRCILGMIIPIARELQW